MLLARLLRTVREEGGRPVVLAGMGGVGKSTLAMALAERVRAGGRHHVWWVFSTETGSLTAGMLAVARQLGASVSDQELIASGSPRAPDVMWEVLDRTKRKWLLVIDNADSPRVLAAPDGPGSSRAQVVDGTGWLRVARQGTVLVTTRHLDASTWGREVQFHKVAPLPAQDAGRILVDLAPNGGTADEARSLGERLGGLPLALQLAGNHLGSEFALIRSFAVYERLLDESAGAVRLLGPDADEGADARRAVMRTWEMSLDALGRAGIPQARTIMRLLSCYAAAEPLPGAVLGSGRAAALREPATAQDPGGVDDLVRLEQGIRGLVGLGLVEAGATPEEPGQFPTLLVHPVVADVSRAHLLDSLGRQDVGSAALVHGAVEIIVDHVDGLRPDEPSDWPGFQGVAPHLRALVGNVGRLVDGEHLHRLLRAVGRLADYYEWSGPAALAEELCRVALAGVDDVSPEHRVPVHGVRYWLGRSISLQGRWAEARDVLLSLLEDQLVVCRPDDPDVLRTRGELARLDAELGRYDAAEAALGDILEIHRHARGDDDRETLATRHAIGIVVSRQKRWQDAERAFRAAAEGRAAVYGPEHPFTLSSRNRLAWALGEQGRTEQARGELREILAVRRRLFGADHHDTLATRERIGWLLALEGRLGEAEAELSEVIAARVRVVGPDYPSTLNSRTLLAQVLVRAGRQTEARTLFEEVRERQIRQVGPLHPKVRELDRMLADCS
ncbi:tetratricopeptide repeat protein [Streptomyces sp. NPDC001822]|uniref:tetratricopeptide repeat protein n=1 Tax=Streptomyces sp. NPDC001822 TaxID=3364614 RepID=UPI0036CE6947